MPSALFLNSASCLSTLTIDSRHLKTSSILDTDFEDILIPDYQTSTKSILKDLRVQANARRSLQPVETIEKSKASITSYLLLAAEFHTGLLNCDNFSMSHDTPL